MDNSIGRLEQTLQESDSILITSHLGPDADSLCSSLLLYRTLETNYPDKKVRVSMEEEMGNLNFIDSYKDIEFGPLVDKLSQTDPELLIILDANSYARLSREPELVQEYLSSKGVKTAIIDHHEPVGKDETDIYINQGSPAVSQDVYEICFEQLSLKKPDGYAQTAMLGIYSDTGGFIYKNPRHKKTFEVVSQLIDDGADIERIVNQLHRYSDEALVVLKELIANMGHYKDCTFSFVSDEFTDGWLEDGKSKSSMKEGLEIFTQSYLRNVKGRPWGFVVYRDLLAKERAYAASFRALSGTIDVSEIAARLGGGGHKPAAGAKVKANSIEEALKKVKQGASFDG